MELTGSLSKISESSYKFVLSAHRLKEKEGEYLPNSETFRVIVFSEDGREVFSSDDGQNYLMVIKDVAPKLVDETKEFEYFWNVKSSEKKILPEGKYFAKLIIPAIPSIYSIQIQFEIP